MVVLLSLVTVYAKFVKNLYFVELQELYTKRNILITENKVLTTKYIKNSSLIHIESKAKKSLNMFRPKKIHKL